MDEEKLVIGQLDEKIIDEGPKIKLLHYFENPMANAVAAARTCYSPKVIEEAQVTKEQIERISKGTFEGGHHTVYQHATFEFSMEGISRQFVWQFLHSHPFYNSEQQSQRYVKLNEIRATIPPSLAGKSLEIYKNAIVNSWKAYNDITQILLNDFIDGHRKLKKAEPDKKTVRGLEKKSIELARYVIPIAAHTAMIHTVNALTLFRLYKIMNQYGCAWEQKLIISRMVKEVKKIDPEFFNLVKDPLNLEETPEFILMKEHPATGSGEFIKEFDSSLEGRSAKLVAYLPNAEKIVADSVRAVVGKSSKEMGDDEAIGYVLDPSKNLYLNLTLDLATNSPLTRALNHPYYVFRKKLSHTADSQDQRHRMVPASRPLISLTATEKPDYIIPSLIEKNSQAREIFEKCMADLWVAKNELVKNGVDAELAVYALPNALAVRIEESGNLLNLWHKWKMRLCLNAQKEIWEHSIDEVEQVRKVQPKLVQFIGAPCQVRIVGKIKPFCTEGDHWCLLPVWVWKDMKKEARA